MIAMLKKVLPQPLVNKVRNYLYFNGFFMGKPKVHSIIIRDKRLYLSSAIDVTHWERVEFGNNVFLWHYTILDSFNGIKIGNDCQIGTRVGIFTHSSHHSIRYYNSAYHDVYFADHKGRIKGCVEIGDCTFVGANSIIMPSTSIGKGCIVSAFSYVQGRFEDYSIISGNPAKKIGDVRSVDYRFLKSNPDVAKNYLNYFGYKTLEELGADRSEVRRGT